MSGKSHVLSSMARTKAASIRTAHAAKRLYPGIAPASKTEKTHHPKVVVTPVWQVEAFLRTQLGDSRICPQMRAIAHPLIADVATRTMRFMKHNPRLPCRRHMNFSLQLLQTKAFALFEQQQREEVRQAATTLLDLARTVIVTSETEVNAEKLPRLWNPASVNDESDESDDSGDDDP